MWGLSAAGLETRAVDMHVLRLRGKLRAADAIRTVRACGYMAGADLSVPGAP